MLFKWCPFTGGVSFYHSECGMRAREVSKRTIKRISCLSKTQMNELQQIIEGGSKADAQVVVHGDATEGKKGEAAELSKAGKGDGPVKNEKKNTSGKNKQKKKCNNGEEAKASETGKDDDPVDDGPVETEKTNSSKTQSQKKVVTTKKMQNTKEKQGEVEYGFFTPEMSVAKKATTDDLGSEVKEPVTKKMKFEETPQPKLELSGDTTAILKNIDRDTDEFWRLEDVLSGNMNGQNQDYNESRIKQGKRPLSFVLVAAQRIDNPVLESRFEVKKKQIAESRGAKDARERYAFHGPHPSKIQAISNTGLLPFGHVLNSSKACVDAGWFGSCRKGVYVSRYADYTLKYCNQGKPLNPGEKCRTILFRCMPGLSKHIEKVCEGMDPTPGFDSHSSPHYSEWFLFNSDQCCPSHVLTVEALENVRTAADDM